MKVNPNIQGEGDYESAKRYNDEAHKFVKEHNPQAQNDESPLTQEEVDEMNDAEAIGKARAKEEDPEITRNYGNQPTPSDEEEQ